MNFKEEPRTRCHLGCGSSSDEKARACIRDGRLPHEAVPASSPRPRKRESRRAPAQSAGSRCEEGKRANEKGRSEDIRGEQIAHREARLVGQDLRAAARRPHIDSLAVAFAVFAHAFEDKVVYVRLGRLERTRSSLDWVL